MRFDSQLKSRDTDSTKENVAAAHISKRHLVTPRNATSATFERIRRWIHECCHTHKGCPNPEASEMPTRTLEISQNVTDNSLHLELAATKGYKGRYVALSYAWGRNISFQTSQNSLKSMEQGFAITEMPQTLQDAAKVAFELGIPHLWVDSLCIIQDSDEDKLLEISKMGDVYAKAFLTISATNASHAYEGFLHNQSQQGKIVEVPYLCPDGTIGAMCLRPKWWYRLKREPLNQRAWAFQERLLSPRLLDYTSLHIVWQCRTAKLDHKDLEGHDFFGGKAEKIPLILNPSHQKLPLNLREEEILETWDWVLEEFTFRSLTVKTDRLPAIAGIASYFQRILGDKYCAGLWLRHLQRGLLWVGSRDAYLKDVKYGRPIARLSAPSWS